MRLDEVRPASVAGPLAKKAELVAAMKELKEKELKDDAESSHKCC